ncbi:MAG: SDR family NAD(P)-dependent oxidoreductase [Pseudomonadota bacterium]
MPGRLEGKVAVITGGASGMGLATVRRFVDEGAHVVIGDIQDEGGEAIARELGDRVRYQRCDVSHEEEVAALVACATASFGRLDCIFNNAGFGGVGGELDQLELGERYRHTVDVLFTGVLAGIKHGSAAMKESGGGSIINTASVAGLRGGWGPHVYSAMKAAVINLSKSAALELGEYGIRVNAICPGFIATAIFAGAANMNWQQRMQFIAALEENDVASTPIQRPGRGKDIADMALFLASDESTFITGQRFVVDGGLTAGTRRERQPGEPSRFQQIIDRIQQDDAGDA